MTSLSTFFEKTQTTFAFHYIEMVGFGLQASSEAITGYENYAIKIF